MRFLIFIDIDGTLKRSDGTISKRTSDTIKELTDQGHVVAICSARPRYHASKVADMAQASCYLISSNGAEIYDKTNEKLIFSEYISKDTIKKIYEETKTLDIRTLFSCENTEYATKYIKDQAQTLLTEDNKDILFTSDIKQIMVIDYNKEAVKQYRDEITNMDEVYIVDKSKDNKDYLSFSLVSTNASKGNALKTLANYLNIPMQDTIAIGNDNNDISMLKIAGTGVAVENSTPELLECADVITASNDEDGVAIYLESLKNTHIKTRRP